MAITVDIPDGKVVMIHGPGQIILKTQTPDQVELQDFEIEPASLLGQAKDE